jgi:hypothetical protein
MSRTVIVNPGTTDDYRPKSTSITSAGSTARAEFVLEHSDAGVIKDWATKLRITFIWSEATHAIAITALTGKTFLESYASTTYTPSTPTLSSASNRTFSITANNSDGTHSTTGAGTLTFQTPIHKSNASATTTNVTLTTTCTRPASVFLIASPASITLGPTTSTNVNSDASFTYPSFRTFTASSTITPTTQTVVSGTSFAAGVISLGDQVKNFAGNVTVPAGDPQIFWIGVRASSPNQPSSFKTGTKAEDAAAVAVVIAGRTVDLEPDPKPVGYTAERYNLWGFTLQPGTTYVSIS